MSTKFDMVANQVSGGNKFGRIVKIKMDGKVAVNATEWEQDVRSKAITWEVLNFLQSSYNRHIPSHLVERVMMMSLANDGLKLDRDRIIKENKFEKSTGIKIKSEPEMVSPQKIKQNVTSSSSSDSADAERRKRRAEMLNRNAVKLAKELKQVTDESMARGVEENTLYVDPLTECASETEAQMAHNANGVSVPVRDSSGVQKWYELESSSQRERRNRFFDALWDSLADLLKAHPRFKRVLKGDCCDLFESVLRLTIVDDLEDRQKKVKSDLKRPKERTEPWETYLDRWHTCVREGEKLKCEFSKANLLKWAIKGIKDKHPEEFKLVAASNGTNFKNSSPDEFHRAMKPLLQILDVEIKEENKKRLERERERRKREKREKKENESLQRESEHVLDLATTLKTQTKNTSASDSKTTSLTINDVK